MTLRHLKRVLDLLTDYEGVLPKRLSQPAAAHYRALRRIVAHPDLVGLGIAGKVSAGKRSKDLAIVFYVRRKLARSRLSISLAVPPVIAAPSGEAIFTDVVEIGDVVPQAGGIASGGSIGHRDAPGGTLGAIVTCDGEKMALSNAHVLALEGFAQVGDPVLLPAGDSNGQDPRDRIATLSSFRRLRGGGAYINLVDAALAAISPAALARLDLSIPNAKLPLRTMTPERKMPVLITRGNGDVIRSTIVDADATVQVAYPRAGLVGFRNQVLCEPPFTQPRDSGSLVLHGENGRVLGLHFAASTKGSYFTPIATVMAQLGFTF